jgi:hypothetical protein
MDIKQEDLKRFWTWAGFKKEDTRPFVTWRYGKQFFSLLPEITLDNLYQFAIPKLQDKGGLNSYSIKETEDKCRITQDKMIRANFRRVL